MKVRIFWSDPDPFFFLRLESGVGMLLNCDFYCKLLNVFFLKINVSNLVMGH